MPKFKVTFQEKRVYFTTYEVVAKTAELAVEAITTDGMGEEIGDEFESTEERTHVKTEEIPFRAMKD
jgi:hypothetical protein